MTAASLKPINPMARLHMGCGESLSRLLIAEADVVVKPSQHEPRDGQGETQSRPKYGGEK
jgi:hypothetical protein